MKNVNDAYKYTMEMINSLKKEGIEVELEIPRCIRESENPNELDTVKKYCPPERLHWKKWRHVTFKVKNQEEINMIFFVRNVLTTTGCSFDSGGGCNGIDWEIDWSFNYSESTAIKLDAALKKVFLNKLNKVDN